MKRTNNVSYRFDGQYVDTKEFMRLLCESVKKILESEHNTK